MAKRTINLDKLESAETAILVESLRPIVRELRRRLDRQTNDELARNNPNDEKLGGLSQRFELCGELNRILDTWPQAIGYLDLP